MLYLPHGIVIPNGQELLKVALDVVLGSKRLAELDHAKGVFLPIGLLRHWDVAGAPDFKQIYKFMSCANDLDARLTVESRFEADPCEDSNLMEFLENRDSIAGKCGAPLPLQRESIVKRGERGGERIALQAVEVNVRQSPRTTLGEYAKTQSVVGQVSSVGRVSDVSNGL